MANRTMAEAPRRLQMGVPVSPAEREVLRRAAAYEGGTICALMRRVSLRAARRIIREEEGAAAKAAAAEKGAS